MANFGKKLFGVAVLGAAAAAAYYYLQKKDQDIPVDMDDDDEYEEFEEDEYTEAPKEKRSYVNLDFNTVEEKAKEAANKLAESANKAANSFGSFLSQAEGKVEEFFDDRKQAPTQPTEKPVDEAAKAESNDGDDAVTE